MAADPAQDLGCAALRATAAAMAIWLLAAVSLAVPAQAADTVFTVGNYPVEARADNAVAAKERALADGQQAAFRSLLKRLVPVTAYPRLKRFASVRAGDLVEGVSIRAERNSSTDYIASLDFSFQARAVRDMLRREGIPFLDQQAPALTVIPVWSAAPGTPYADNPTWTNTWKSLDLEHALTPVKLQSLKREVPAASLTALANGDGSAIRVLAGAYGSEFVLVAFAEPDPSARRLNVTLSGRDSVGAFTLKRAYRLDLSDPAYAREFAAVVSLGILEGRWKAGRAGVGRGGEAADGAAAGGGPIDMLIAVEFRGMGEWQDISRRLAATPGIQELEVAGLSARSARVTLRYPEGGEHLAQVLGSQGLQLRNDGGNWVLRLQ